MPLGGQDEQRLLAALRRAAPVVPRPRRREGAAALRAGDSLRGRPHLRRGRPHRRSCCAAPTWRATSRTIEVVLVARKEVGVGRGRRHRLAVVQHLDLLVLEPFQQFAAIDARRRRDGCRSPAAPAARGSSPDRRGSADRCPAAPDGPWSRRGRPSGRSRWCARSAPTARRCRPAPASTGPGGRTPASSAAPTAPVLGRIASASITS